MSSIVNFDQGLNLDHLYQPSVIQLAREGDFRAIAYWLNGYLIPHGIYARVEAAQPGCLQVWIECYRIPQPDRLIRYICYRLCKLNSPIIRGARIATRLAGTAQVQWERSVRIVTPTQKTYRRMRPTPSTPDWSKIAAQATLQLKLAAQDYRQHPYSHWLNRSAIAAFVIGCGVEAVNFQPTSTLTSQRGSGAVSQLAVASDRSESIAAALESVEVIPHPSTTAGTAVTLAFGGDNLLGQVLSSSTADEVGATTRDESGLAEYRQADVALAQLSRPLANARQQLTDEDPIASIQALTASEVDVVNLANTQMAESGLGDLRQTLTQLEESGIHAIGAGRNQREARRPQILDVKGQRIAYLGYSDSDVNAAQPRAAGVNFGTDEQITTDIQALRDQVDWIIVNYHWSQNLAEYPGEQQMHLARLAIDQGADLVVGHHPNVLQGAEVYKGRAIAYSLGNFIFAHQDGEAQSDYDTAVLKVSLGEDQMRLEFLPVQVRQSKPAIVSGEKGEAVLRYLEQASGLFEQPMRSPMTLEALPPEPTQPRPAPFEETESEDPFLEPLDTPTRFDFQTEDPPTESDAWDEDSLQWTQPDTSDSFITYPDAGEELPEAESQDWPAEKVSPFEAFPVPPEEDAFDAGQIEVQPVAIALPAPSADSPESVESLATLSLVH